MFAEAHLRPMATWHSGMMLLPVESSSGFDMFCEILQITFSLMGFS